jgi:hypothetical protein
MTIRRTLSALLLCVWISQAAWADPTLLPGTQAPKSSAAGKSGGVRVAPHGGLARRPDPVHAGLFAHPAMKFERPRTGRPVPDGGQVAVTDSSAGDLSRNLLVALLILRQRFQ